MEPIGGFQEMTLKAVALRCSRPSLGNNVQKGGERGQSENWNRIPIATLTLGLEASGFADELRCWQ
jgi:hypothetical protein